MLKKIFRYSGVILFVCIVVMKIGRYAAGQEYDFAITFAIFTISALVEGWFTHALYINSEIFKLRKDNIELFSENLKLRWKIREERNNGKGRGEKDS